MCENGGFLLSGSQLYNHLRKADHLKRLYLANAQLLFFLHVQTSLHLALMCRVGFTNHIVCDKAVPAYPHVSSRKKRDKVECCLISLTTYFANFFAIHCTYKDSSNFILTKLSVYTI